VACALYRKQARAHLEGTAGLSPMRNKVSASDTMIVQKQRSRTYNGTTYFRYRVTIPTHIAEQLNIKGGERVDVILRKKTFVISFD